MAKLKKSSKNLDKKILSFIDNRWFDILFLIFLIMGLSFWAFYFD